MKAYTIFLVFVCSIGVRYGYAQSSIHLSPLEQSRNISNSDLKFYIDSSGDTEVYDLISFPERFAAIKGRNIFKYTSYPIWIGFQLTKDAEDSFTAYFLELANAHLADYKVYFLEHKTNFHIQLEIFNFFDISLFFLYQSDTLHVARFSNE